MIRHAKTRYDCLVIGGGPAGCTTAALVAKAGFETLLVERDEVPRFHVGESLMPETYWTLKRLGVIDKLERSEFSRKIGVQFVDETGKQSQPFFFRQHDNRDSSETWHVERAHFDKLLFDNAAEKGADCLDRTRVVELDLRSESPHRAVLRDGIDGLSSGDISATQLGKWTADFKRGIQLFCKLVDAFYTNEFSFARFLKEHPEHHSNLTDLLIGRAFYPEAGRIFEDLDPALEAARSAAMS